MIKKTVALVLGALLSVQAAYGAGNITIRIDDRPLVTEVAPVVENGRTLVPFRAIFEALGLRVDWNDELKTATAYNGSTNVAVKLDSRYGSINGELKELEASARIAQGRTLVPLRFISEAFGNEVRWDPKGRTVSIVSGFKAYQYTEELPAVGSFERLKLIMEYAGRYTQPVLMRNEMATAVPAAAEKSAVADGTGYSGTNLQVANVDEGDIVKTDGNYIYQLRERDLKITAIGTGVPQAAAALTFQEGVFPSEMYLHSGKLIIIGSRSTYTPYGSGAYSKMIMPMNTPVTQILFYDVRNPLKPEYLRKYELEGTYTTSRLTGGNLYLVANKWLNTYAMKEDDVLPLFSDSATGKSERATFADVRYFPDSVEANLMMTVGFNLSDMKSAPHRGLYLGGGSTVYADQSSMIVAMERYHYRILDQSPVQNTAPSFDRTTELVKFRLQGGAVNFSAKGSVPGTVLNQFSMDSYAGNYRIATTVGDNWGGGESRNNLYVLDTSLRPKGKIEGLAPGERIYSVRFLGDRAYMVTFRQVDPFYVIDLKDSAQPKVLGYLKIPGFSDYLHPWDGTTVIGFGKETQETANGPIVTGIKMALFDVSNVSNPVEKSKVVLGSSGSWSEALNNHKALMASPEKGLLALPVTLYEGLGRENRFAFQGAYVYTVDPAKGLVLRGTSTHLSPEEVRDTELKWYDTSKEVQRIIWSGDSLYTLSQYGIKSYDLESMALKGNLIH